MTDENGKVIDLRKKQEERLQRSGELFFVLCPQCQDEHFGFAPVCVTGPGGKPVIVSLMCLSEKCQGETVIDVLGGVMSDARPFI